MSLSDSSDFPAPSPLTGLPAWQALIRHLSLVSGPDLLFLITPDVHGARTCRSALRGNLPGDLGPLIHLKPDVPNDPKTLVTCLESAAGGSGKPLFWIEPPEEVLYEAIPEAQAAWDRAFTALNPHRNHLLQGLAGPLVFAGPPWLFQSFRSHAPDWFSVRAGVFDLPRDIEQAYIPSPPLKDDDIPRPEPLPGVKAPEFPSEQEVPSPEDISSLLPKITQPEIILLLTLSWLDPDHPVPIWLLASHPDLPDGAGVPETVEKLAGRKLLTLSLDKRWLKIHSEVSTAVSETLIDPISRNGFLEVAFAMFDKANLGTPEDVRNWPKWNSILPHAISLCEQVPDEPPPQGLTWLLSQLGVFLGAKGHFLKAEKYARRALEIDRITYGSNDPKVAILLNNLAYLLQHTNRLSEAEPLFREALCIDRASYGHDHPEIAIDLNNLAYLLKDTNRLTEAEPMFREAVRIDRVSYGDNHPNVARGLNNLALLLQATNRLTEAEPLMRETLRIDRASYGHDHPNIARDLNNLASLLKETNRLTEAEPLLREALHILQNSLGPDHPNTVLVSKNLDHLLAKMAETKQVPED